jgi:hypothetical protein
MQCKENSGTQLFYGESSKKSSKKEKEYETGNIHV